MTVLKPFKGIRPLKDKAHLIAAKPYDVLTSEEARIEAKGNPLSFLHVSKSEIDLPLGTDPYSPVVYKKAKENFQIMMDEGIFFQDKKECLYVYSQTMNGKTQYGLVGCASVDDYFNNVIKKHELTRPDKEKDRTTHLDVTNLNTGPVFITYPDNIEIDEIIDKVIQIKPEYDFKAIDGVQHTLWIIDDDNLIQKLVLLFKQIPSVYIADGHHRSASGAGVGKKRREHNKSHTGKEEYNFFLAVHFPTSQLNIMDYNRAVKDLNGLAIGNFMENLKMNFEIIEKGTPAFKPAKLHEFGMYIEKKWYSLTAKKGIYNDQDPIDGLDVTILSKYILEPLLGIKDLRTDKRIDFIGGIRGLGELEKRVNSGEMKVAFALFPVTIQQLINISDSGNIMPPKTTWFEPKLRSGLVVHAIS